MANVINAVAEHDKAVDSPAKGKSFPYLRVQPGGGHHVRMQKPGAKKLKPPALPLHVYLHPGLHECEIAGPEAYLRVGTGKFFEKELKCPLQFRHRNVL